MGGGGAKERILRGEEDQNTLHIYVQRLCNKTHQILKRREGKENGNIMEGVNLFKVHCKYVWNYHNEPPHIIKLF
jgi:hypothetical protein